MLHAKNILKEVELSAEATIKDFLTVQTEEKRFYQKVRDLFALSSGYQQREQETQRFFAQAQNKLLYAVTNFIAAELVLNRADSSQANMALITWKGSQIRQQDVIAMMILIKDGVSARLFWLMLPI